MKGTVSKMKKMLRTAIAMIVLAAMALSMVACGGESATTTTAAGTEAPTVTTAAGDSTTAAPVTTVAPVTTAAPVTDAKAGGPYDFYAEEEVIDFCGYTFVNNNGMASIDDNGHVVADSRLTMLSSWDAVMYKGKITGEFTSAAGNQSNDNGIVFNLQGAGIKGLSEDPDFKDNNEYFFENTYTYYFFLMSDGQYPGLAKVYHNTTAWSWLKLSSLDEMAALGIEYAHGDTFTLSAETDGAGNIKCYFNDTLIIECTDDDPIVGGGGFGARLEEIGVTLNSIKIEPAD